MNTNIVNQPQNFRTIRLILVEMLGKNCITIKSEYYLKGSSTTKFVYYFSTGGVEVNIDSGCLISTLFNKNYR